MKHQLMNVKTIPYIPIKLFKNIISDCMYTTQQRRIEDFAKHL